MIKVEVIGLEHAAADIATIEEILDTRAPVERARAEETAEYRIDRERTVTAAPQSMRQATRDPAGSYPRDVKLETAKRARRKSRKHIVLGIPAWTARTLDQERPR